jgi:hypothetical protein
MVSVITYTPRPIGPGRGGKTLRRWRVACEYLAILPPATCHIPAFDQISACDRGFIVPGVPLWFQSFREEQEHRKEHRNNYGEKYREN